MPQSDLLILSFSVAGIIVPIIVNSKFSSKLIWISGAITLCFLFAVSILGAIIIRPSSSLDSGAIFTRIFLIGGTSHMIFLISQISSAYQLDLKRAELERENSHADS